MSALARAIPLFVALVASITPLGCSSGQRSDPATAKITEQTGQVQANEAQELGRLIQQPRRSDKL